LGALGLGCNTRREQDVLLLGLHADGAAGIARLAC